MVSRVEMACLFSVPGVIRMVSRADRRISASASSMTLHTKCLLCFFWTAVISQILSRNRQGIGFSGKEFLRCYLFKDLFVAPFYDTAGASVLKLGDEKSAVRSRFPCRMEKQLFLKSVCGVVIQQEEFRMYCVL